MQVAAAADSPPSSPTAICRCRGRDGQYYSPVKLLLARPVSMTRAKGHLRPKTSWFGLAPRPGNLWIGRARRRRWPARPTRFQPHLRRDHQIEVHPSARPHFEGRHQEVPGSPSQDARRSPSSARPSATDMQTPTPQSKGCFWARTERKLQKLLGARAVDKMRSGREDEITFHDASSFWGISARSSAMSFQARLGDIEGVLRAAQVAAQDRPIRFEHGGRAYAKDDIAELLQLHQSMLDRFSVQLDVIRGRRDER